MNAASKRGRVLVGEDSGAPAKRARAGGNGSSLFSAVDEEIDKAKLLSAILTILTNAASQGTDIVAGSAIMKELTADTSLSPAVVSARAAYGGKGWLRKMLSEDANFELVEGAEPMFRLADPSMRKASIGQKPKAKAAVKRESGVREDVDFDDIEDGVPAGVIIQHAIVFLAEADAAGKPYVQAAEILKSLGPELRDSVKAVQTHCITKLGPQAQKSWLKLLLKTEPSIELVREGCYRILGAQTPLSRTGGAGIAPASMAAAAPVEASSSEVVAIPPELEEEAGQILESVRSLLQAADMEGQGFLTGAALSQTLSQQAELAPLVSAVKEGLARSPAVLSTRTAERPHKGWLKKVLSTDASIELVQPEGLDEPCFRLVGATSPLVNTASKTAKTAQARPGGKAKGGKAAVQQHAFKGKSAGKGMGKLMGMSFDDAWNMMLSKAASMSGVDFSAKPTAAQVLAGKGRGKNKGKAPAMSVKHEQSTLSTPATVSELPPAAKGEAGRLLQTVKAALAGPDCPGYMAGSAISKLLSENSPQITSAAAVVRQTFNGKGWLKKLLACEPEIESVAVDGVDEPCFRLSGQ